MKSLANRLRDYFRTLLVENTGAKGPCRIGDQKPKIKASQEPNRGTRILSHDTPSDGSTNNRAADFQFRISLEVVICLTRCTSEEKAAFADAIHKRSQMTFGEIQRARVMVGPSYASLRIQDFPADCTE